MQIDELTDNMDSVEETPRKSYWKTFLHWPSLLFTVAFLLGISGGYVVWGRPQQVEDPARTVQVPGRNGNAFNIASLAEQVNPPEGYDLGVPYGDLGPQVVATGGIDHSAFLNLYESSGRPLTNEQVEILTEGDR